MVLGNSECYRDRNQAADWREKMEANSQKVEQKDKEMEIGGKQFEGHFEVQSLQWDFFRKSKGSGQKILRRATHE